MKKLLFTIALLAVCASGVSAQSTPRIGIFFDTDLNVLAWPVPFDIFPAYIYIWGAERSITAVEFSLETPDDPSHQYCFYYDVTYPEQTSIYMGDPWSGLSITYWPPLSCYGGEFAHVCTIDLMTTEACTEDGGTLAWYFVNVAEHHDSGELRGACTPDNELFLLYGLDNSAIICQPPWANEPASWGAVKSMMR